MPDPDSHVATFRVVQAVLRRRDRQSIKSLCAQFGVQEKTGEHHYEPLSTRAGLITRRLPVLEYPVHHEHRRVNAFGFLSWQGVRIFLSTVLAGEYVSLEEQPEGDWTIHFGPLTLGTYSTTRLTFSDALAWTDPMP